MTVTVKRVVNKRLVVALKELQQFNRQVGKTGWFENARYPDAPHPQVAYIAAIQENGYPSKNIPARPFIKPTIKSKRNEWASIVRAGSKAILASETTVTNVLVQLTQKAAGDIKETISKIWYPPLKPSTIKNRLRRRANKITVGNLNKPLVDTKHMRDTVIGKVEPKK